MVFAVILAAGSGARMGTHIPKQFLEIHSKPIIIHSIDKFIEYNGIDEIITAVPKEYADYTEALIEKYYPDKKIHVITGGNNRSQTLKKLTDFIFDNFNFDEKSIIITHDGVRPFIDSTIIKNNITAATECGACNTVIAATDTILLSNDGEYITEVFDRTKIYHAQTPQSFNAYKLKELIDTAPAEKLDLLTDGCSLFVMNGLPVKLVEGNYDNIKITYPNDLKKN